MYKVEYVGNENGLFIEGSHFSKNKETEVDEALYNQLKAKYGTEFEFLSEVKINRFQKLVEDDNIRQQGNIKRKGKSTSQ